MFFTDEEQALDRKQQYVITEELVRDIRIAFRLGFDGTLPNDNELIDALRAHPVNKREPTKEDLMQFAKWAGSLQEHALEIMVTQNLKLENLSDPIQKLAFTFYTDLCEINSKSRNLFEDEESTEYVK
jgi:hypothetical protein